MSCCSQSRSVLAAQTAAVLNAGRVWAACSGIMLGQHELFDSTTIALAFVRRPPQTALADLFRNAVTVSELAAQPKIHYPAEQLVN